MKRRLIPPIFVLFFGVLPFFPGCGPDNEKAAKIQGRVPTDGLSRQERREQSQGGVMPKDYAKSNASRRRR